MQVRVLLGLPVLGVEMKAIINAEYTLRGQKITSYYSFPVYSDKIEETLIRELEFLRRMDSKPYSLELKILEEA